MKPKPGEVWYSIVRRGDFGIPTFVVARCLHVTRNGWYRWGTLDCPDIGYSTHRDTWGRTPLDAMDAWVETVMFDLYCDTLGDEDRSMKVAEAVESVQMGIDCFVEYGRAKELV